MSKVPYTPPTYGTEAYNCPSCHAYAKQDWTNVIARGYIYSRIDLVACAHCDQDQVWLDERLIDPASTTVPPPNVDLDDDIRTDYLEAAATVGRSPRSAAALLRLALQKLMRQLELPGRNLNDDIGALVQRGLPVHVQQALDVVRAIGNNSVHPGQIDIRDDPATATALFALVNTIVDVMVSQPKRIAAMYTGLPETVRRQVEERDGPTG